MPKQRKRPFLPASIAVLTYPVMSFQMTFSKQSARQQCFYSVCKKNTHQNCSWNTNCVKGQFDLSQNSNFNVSQSSFTFNNLRVSHNVLIPYVSLGPLDFPGNVLISPLNSYQEFLFQWPQSHPEQHLSECWHACKKKKGYWSVGAAEALQEQKKHIYSINLLLGSLLGK